MTATIKKETLERIIKEEVDYYLNEVALCRDKKGHFSDCKKGATYSLSKKGAARAGVDSKYVGRGKVTSDNKRSDGTYSVQAPYGLNTSQKKVPGRIKMPSGDPVSPKYSVSNYDEQYDEAVDKTEWDPNWKSAKDRKRKRSIQKPSNVSWVSAKEEFSDLAKGRGLGIFEDLVINYDEILEIVSSAFPDDEVNEVQNSLRDRCRAVGLISMGEASSRILKSLNAFALARDGKLNARQS